MHEFLSQHYYKLIYTVFFLCSVSFSFLINSLFLRFFHTLGIRNKNDGTVIRWGAQSKPAIGGLSFYILFLISVACYSFFFNPSQVFYNMKFVGLIISMAIGFIIGLYDDAYDTRPFLKFFAQLLCALVLIFSGIYIHIFSDDYLNYLITIFWVVGIMNSINMLDNMDAITTIVAINIVLGSILMIVIHKDFENMHLIILIGVLSSLFGFIYYNWHPSKMYMGDTGSQFLGVFLAAMGIMYFWNDTYSTQPVAPTRQIFTAILAFLLPIIDTTVVVTNRLSKKKSPFIGGKDHTTHGLAYFGLSDRMVASTFAILSFISLCLIYYINQYLSNWSHLYTIIFSFYFLMLLGFFFYITRHKKVNT
jgi:UDP-GlcNAc:undecaprenyl-phosphate/decaprenyl-phosphate GlcNAc-1-phosphate transferase